MAEFWTSGLDLVLEPLVEAGSGSDFGPEAGIWALNLEFGKNFGRIWGEFGRTNGFLRNFGLEGEIPPWLKA